MKMSTSILISLCTISLAGISGAIIGNYQGNKEIEKITDYMNREHQQVLEHNRKIHALNMDYIDNIHQMHSNFYSNQIHNLHISPLPSSN